MKGLVLSLFPGIDILGMGFELEDWCVVQAADVISGGDVRRFHPPAGRFDGCIGGDPCQSHSSLTNLVRAKGLEPSFPDMTPEFQRVIEEARPAWFLRENVPKAPDLKPAGYDVRSFLLDHSHLDSGDGWGHQQMRRRRFWFGVRDGECPELRQWIDFAWFELPEAVREGPPCGHGPTPGQRDRRKRQAVSGDSRAVPVALGGSRKRKRTAVQGTGRGGPHEQDRVGSARDELGEMLELQGLRRDHLKHCPWTMEGKRKAVGNAVPLPMARAVAKAVGKALE